MPELNLGTKYECYSCGTRFYDLGKPEPVCPKCGANQKDSDRGEGAATSPAARKRRKAEVPKPVVIEEDEAIEDIAVAPDEDLDVVADVEIDEDLEEEEEDFEDEA